MSIRLSLGLTAIALAGVAACASIANLDHSDPATSIGLNTGDGSTNVPGSDGGPGVATTDAGIAISPGSIDFERAGCGTAQTKQVTLSNPAATDVPYSVTLPQSDVFSLEGADANGTVTGTIPAHGTAAFTVDATSNKPGDASADLELQLGSDSMTLTATLETVGGGLSLDPAIIDFGSIRQGVASAPTAVTFKNDGNDSITIDSFSFSGGNTDFTPPASLVVDAHSSITGSFTFNSGNAGAEIDTVATPHIATANLCGTLPTIELKGQRVNTSVTVSPASLDLGSPSCGAAPTGFTKTLTISNYSTNAAIPYQLSLPAGSKFTYGNTPASGNVPKASDANTPGTLTIQIGLTAVGTTPTVLSDTLSVSVTPDGAPSATVQSVALKATVTGAAITLNPTSVTVSDRSYTKTTISNTGNATLCVNYFTDDRQFGFIASQTLTAAMSQSADATFNNDPRDPASSGHITMQATACRGSAQAAVVCGTLPTLTITGQ